MAKNWQIIWLVLFGCFALSGTNQLEDGSICPRSEDTLLYDDQTHESYKEFDPRDTYFCPGLGVKFAEAENNTMYCCITSATHMCCNSEQYRIYVAAGGFRPNKVFLKTGLSKEPPGFVIESSSSAGWAILNSESFILMCACVALVVVLAVVCVGIAVYHYWKSIYYCGCPDWNSCRRIPDASHTNGHVVHASS